MSRHWFIAEWDKGGCVKCGNASRGELRMMFCADCKATEQDRRQALRALKKAGFKPAGRHVVAMFGRFMSGIEREMKS